MTHAGEQNQVSALDLLLQQDDTNNKSFRAAELGRSIVGLPVQHDVIDELARDDNEVGNEVDDMIEGLGEEK